MHARAHVGGRADLAEARLRQPVSILTLSSYTNRAPTPPTFKGRHQGHPSELCRSQGSKGQTAGDWGLTTDGVREYQRWEGFSVVTIVSYYHKYVLTAVGRLIRHMCPLPLSVGRGGVGINIIMPVQGSSWGKKLKCQKAPKMTEGEHPPPPPM